MYININTDSTDNYYRNIITTTLDRYVMLYMLSRYMDQRTNGEMYNTSNTID